MTSRSFVAKYESDCPNCHQKILVGQSAVFPYKNAKQIVHEFCPKTPGTPPEASSKPPEPSGQQEPPIYTFHIRRSQGNNPNDWVEWGVSTRGLPPMADHIAFVKARAQDKT